MGDVHYIRPTLDPRSEIPFEPWYTDIYALTDLWYWMVWRKVQPKDPAYFFTHGEEFAEEYGRMKMWKGEGA